MNTVAVVLIAIVATLAVVGIVGVIFKNRQQGNLLIPWEQIRPLLTEVFVEVIKIKEADKLGYDALETYAVNFVRGKMNASMMFTEEEKALLSDELIRSLISSRLKELYNKE